MSASPSIFISYRVADSQPQAGRLFDALERAFGTGTAFYDKDGLKPGMKWPDELAQKVKKARVVLVLIADLSKWIGVGVEGRRIDDPDDWVRLEVEHALADTQKLVIPVLFNDGQLPTEKGLPESCRGLLKCQSIRITDANWARDLAPLLARLREHLGIAEDPQNRQQQATSREAHIHKYTINRGDQKTRFDDSGARQHHNRPEFPPTRRMPAPLKTFIIYARADAGFKDELVTHLHLFVEYGYVEKWVDSDLLPGEEWEKRIEQELDTAHLVIILVSADALRSEFIRKKELKRALEKKRSGSARVIPVLVRECTWELHPELSTLQFLPKDDNGRIRGVAGWISRDEAWAACLRELKKLIDEVGQELEKELEQTQKAAEAEAHKKQLEAEKDEKKRNRADEAFWNHLQKDLENVPEPAHKIELYQAYLMDADNRNHREEAEDIIEDLQAQLAAARKAEAAKAESLRKKEAAARAEAERLEREAQAAEQARLEAERLEREGDAAEQPRLEDERRHLEAEVEAARKKAEDDARKKGLPDMVFVKGGTFQMGSNEHDSEKPIHNVTLADFEIGKYPVTQKLWTEIMGKNPAKFKGDDLPVENVSWHDAQDFLQKLNARFPGMDYRLPTEAEWEYAACGGEKGAKDHFIYAGSNNLDEVGWYDKTSGSKTHPVGGKKPNQLGLYDMSGNVWEWCADWYGAYHSGPVNNPTGPAKGSARVLRGGGWYDGADHCRVAYRDFNTPGYRHYYLGFRVARSPQ
jgi:formylglycine-generating enzyme required for sulfatase activity